MKITKVVLFFMIIFILSCINNHKKDIGELSGVDDKFMILDDALLAIGNIWSSLPAKVNKSVLAKAKLEKANFIFLKLSEKVCDLCATHEISYLKEFKEIFKENHIQIYIIVDSIDEKENSNFISGFNFNKSDVIFLESNFSELDQIGNGSYLGMVKNSVIYDALPVNQLLNKEFVMSFLAKLK